ncbi:membrane-anchored junction protein isoform X4 [Mustela putorius furo]|uniref:Membrane-anchored junction protein isoform X4 n=1 Tax=Mustela putorius furo TaxID=9669 RepID=A0A8U0R9W9_MUSPF|nr:membrane-anchored junction protein isoform X4 [Mustela putorius furo]
MRLSFGSMSLKPFTYPFPETRFLHAGPNVYKFKIRYGNSIRGKDIENKEVIVQELEDSIRVVLGNLDNLQPFATEHFIVFPSLEKESQEAGSSLKVLAERKAAGAMTRKRKRVEVPSSPSRPALDRTKMGISSQGPSKKKPLMDTRRNGERKTQQEWQDTPTFNTTDIQEQDSKWEDSLAQQIIPPLQQNHPPPPKGPPELGTSGFFGFLRSLFPFRYFFRRSSQ